MQREPQHIRRRCTPRTYQAVDRGERTFEVFVGDDLQPEPGDLLTLEEWDPDEKKYTGHHITRKISYVLNTKRAGFPDDEIVRHGVTVCGTTHPDLNTLKALLHDHYACSIIIEVQDNGKHTVLTGPFYLPPLSAPPLYELGLFDDLDLAKWPIGIYDVTILVFPDPKRDRFVVIDQLINGAVYTDDGSILAIQLDYQALRVGKIKDLTGRQLQVADPMEVKSLQDVEETAENDEMVHMRMDNALSVRVEEELAEMLDGFEDEEEENDYAD